jgi:hypothetical protein
MEQLEQEFAMSPATSKMAWAARKEQLNSKTTNKRAAKAASLIHVTIKKGGGKNQKGKRLSNMPSCGGVIAMFNKLRRKKTNFSWKYINLKENMYF